MTTSKLVSYITNFEVTSKTDDDFMKNILSYLWHGMDKRKLESHIIFCSFIYSSIGGDVVKDFLSLSNIRQTYPGYRQPCVWLTHATNQIFRYFLISSNPKFSFIHSFFHPSLPATDIKAEETSCADHESSNRLCIVIICHGRGTAQPVCHDGSVCSRRCC